MVHTIAYQYIKTFYINGISTSKKGASLTVQKIDSKLMCKVRLHYNNSIDNTIYTLAQAIFSPCKARDSFDQVRKRKLDCALLLKSRVKKFLKKNPKNHIFIIGHSQGTDVVTLLLLNLKKKYRSRMKVFSLGGIDIKNKVKTTHNFVHRNDQIPKAMRARDKMLGYKNLSDESHTIKEVSYPETINPYTAHLINTYLSSRRVLKTLKREEKDTIKKIRR